MKLLNGGAINDAHDPAEERARIERELRHWGTRPRFTRACLRTAAHEALGPAIEHALVQLGLMFEAEPESLEQLAGIVGLSRILPSSVVADIVRINITYPPLALEDESDE